MESGGKKVRSIRSFTCGSCINNQRFILRGASAKKMRFPAKVFLLEHHNLGYLLFDTGYSQAVKHNGLVAKLYNLLNPIELSHDQVITAQLRAIGISSQEIKAIILSHLHPDHIGGLPLFREPDIYVSPEIWAQVVNPKQRSLLVFDNLLQQPLVKYQVITRELTDHFLNRYFPHVYDVLGDGSILGVALEGHASGQIGVYLPEWNILLAADAAWNKFMLHRAKQMHWLARMVQHDFTTFLQTARDLRILEAEHPEIEIYFTHEQTEEFNYV